MTTGRGHERWKLTVIGAVLAIASALESGLVVAQWAAQPSDQRVAEVAQVCAALSAGVAESGRTAC